MGYAFYFVQLRSVYGFETFDDSTLFLRNFFKVAGNVEVPRCDGCQGNINVCDLDE